MDDPWDDVDAAGDVAAGRSRRRCAPDVVHLNGYAHGGAAVAARRWWSSAHSCVLSWWRAVRGGDAPAEWNAYRRAVRAGLRAADGCRRADGGDAARAVGALRPLRADARDRRTAATPRAFSTGAEGAARPQRRTAVGRGEERRGARRGGARACRGRCCVAGETRDASGRRRRGCTRRRRMLGGCRRTSCAAGWRAPPSSRCPRATSRSGSSSLEAALVGLRAGARRHPEPARGLGRTPRCSSRPTIATRCAARSRALIDDPARRARARPRARRRARRGFTRGADGGRATSALYAALRRTRTRGRAGGRVMRVVIFCHSLVSDWNHGNAHFLRGVVARAASRAATRSRVYEPRDGWSVRTSSREHGRRRRSTAFQRAYPGAAQRAATTATTLDLDAALDGADLVIVHEWNEPALVARASASTARAAAATRCCSTTRTTARSPTPDEHGRATTSPTTTACSRSASVIRDVYLERGWAARAWTWHEAADTARLPPACRRRGATATSSGSATGATTSARASCDEFLSSRCARSACAARSRRALSGRRARSARRAPASTTAAGCRTIEVPGVFARYRVTVHVPRRPYVDGAARHPDHPPVRGARLRHPARLARRGTTPRACSRRAATSSSRATAREMTRAARAPCSHDPTLAARARRRRAAGRSSRATPAPTASTSCSAIVRRARRHRRPARPCRERRMTIAFFGSSLVSAYWNGAATYYRGIIRALHARGHRVTFYEPDAYERQQHRDIADPDWAAVVVYPATATTACARALEQARGRRRHRQGQRRRRVRRAARGGGARAASGRDALVVFWDVDAPATLDRVQRRPDDPFRALIPRYDLVLTYGGGDAGGRRATRRSARARACRSTTRSIPTRTTRSPPDRASPRDLAFLGNRLPDREARVEEFFLARGRALPGSTLPARRQRLGRQAAARRTCATSATSTRATTTRSTARRWPCSTSTATAWRAYGFSPRDPRVRGGRRRRLPDHRRLGGHRAVPRAGREVLVARDGDGGGRAPATR